MRITKTPASFMTTALSLVLVSTLTSCGGVAAKAIDIKRCDAAHTNSLIKSELPYMAPANDGMDHADPSNVLSLIAAGFEPYDPTAEKGLTDAAYQTFASAVKEMQTGYAKNINGKYSTMQDYYDTQTELATKFLAAVDEFGKACVTAGAGDAFRNGV